MATVQTGRPRRHDPSIPAHIDQARIPPGLYWRAGRAGGGVWYVKDAGTDGEPPRKRNVASADAKLSDLYAIVEARAGGPARGTLEWMLDEFHASTKFRSLAPATRRDYEFCRRVLVDFPTSNGLTLGKVDAGRLTRVNVQRIVEKIAQQGTPSKANHVLRYLRRAYEWAANHVGVGSNPAAGVEQAKERQRRRLPGTDVYAAVLAYARAGAALKPHTKGSCAPYLWICMELGYLCRLRPVEAMTLTDANVLAGGLLTNRTKGSRDNVTRWNPRLRAAIDGAVALRQVNFRRAGRPWPLRPADRPLVVSEDGTPLARSSLDSAWGRLLDGAVRAGVIGEDQRFGLHDLKRRGATDTKGNRADVQDAGGWRNAAMVDVYDLSLPVVDPAAGN